MREHPVLKAERHNKFLNQFAGMLFWQKPVFKPPTIWDQLSCPPCQAPHSNEKNPIYVFLFWELRGLNPNYIHVSVSYLYIFPRSGPHISCNRIGRSIVGIYKSSQTHEYGNWDCGCAIPILEIFVSNFTEFSVLVLCSALLKQMARRELNPNYVQFHPLREAKEL